MKRDFNLKRLSTCLWILPIILVINFSSCKKERSEAHEVEKVHRNPNELLQYFKEVLGSGSRSFKAILNPRSGQTYSLYLSLTTDQKVYSLIDLSVETARTIKEGRFTLIENATHPYLNFSTGTYLDLITHKEGFRTVGADTSYAFQFQQGDTIFMRGNRNGDELLLIDLKAEEVPPYEHAMFGNGYIYLYNFFTKSRFFSFTSDEGIPVQFIVNQGGRMMRVYYAKDGKLHHSSADFAYGMDRIRFKNPLQIGNQMISELLVDSETDEVYIPKKDNQRVKFLGAKFPVIPLHYLLGEEVTSVISLPSPKNIVELLGWSTSFSETYDLCTKNLLNSSLKGNLLVLAFEMDMRRNLMFLSFYMAINNNYIKAPYPMSFTKSADGEFKFTAYPFNDNDQAQVLAKTMQPLFQPLLDIVLNNKYKIDYYDNKGAVIGQLKSTSNPDLFFTGEFRSYFN